MRSLLGDAPSDARTPNLAAAGAVPRASSRFVTFGARDQQDEPDITQSSTARSSWCLWVDELLLNEPLDARAHLPLVSALFGESPWRQRSRISPSRSPSWSVTCGFSCSITQQAVEAVVPLLRE